MPRSFSNQLPAILIFMSALLSCILDKVNSTNVNSINPETGKKYTFCIDGIKFCWMHKIFSPRVRNPKIFFPLTTSTSTVTYTADIWTVCFRQNKIYLCKKKIKAIKPHIYSLWCCCYCSLKKIIVESRLLLHFHIKYRPNFMHVRRPLLHTLCFWYNCKPTLTSTIPLTECIV